MKDDVNIVFCGEAGQGVQTAEALLVRAFKQAGYHVFATKEYMSRIRGGSNSTDIRVSSRAVNAPLKAIDICVPLHKGALNHLAKRISPETIVIGDADHLAECECGTHVESPFAAIAKEAGGKIFATVAAAGAVAGLLGMDDKAFIELVGKAIAKKGEEIVKKNKQAASRGIVFGRKLREEGRGGFALEPDPEVSERIVVTGAEAVALGALAGGCDFLSSYPMSPSTGVMTFLAAQAASFGLVVEQAEDEISAVNMALGAWYAGARAMVTTSGGGFALMVEGLSLAGIIESPLVIHLAQRPGPATGLPTRTEQGDLEFALYSGHGEFPRILLAPGTREEAFLLAGKAFDLADKHQVPVILLTDQFLMDSYADTPPFDPAAVEAVRRIHKTEAGYKRYTLSLDGISPRGIPGYGDGLVGVDSDEHDEEAHITEDLELRTKMVVKRLRKADGILREAIPPEYIGEPGARVLVVTWGSTRNPVREALAAIGRKDVAQLHFSQVWPLHPSAEFLLARAKRRILVEGNATAQFGRLLHLYAGAEMSARILRCDGLPFAADETAERLREVLDREALK
jgi:2-oxoglutarate/2-oxoacid ferredoxin oxidoreductase subunit alpha